MVRACERAPAWTIGKCSKTEDLTRPPLPRFSSTSGCAFGADDGDLGNIPPAEAEKRYYAMLDEPAMAA